MEHLTLGNPSPREFLSRSRRGTSPRGCRRALALLVLACSGVLTAQVPSAPIPLREAATQAFARHQYRQAADLYAQLAAADGAGSEALLLQAKCLVNLKEFPQADAALHRFVAASPRSSEALYLLGFVLQRENHPAASLETFTQAAAIRPPRPDDLQLVALDYVLLNDYNDAVHWLTRAVAGDPGNAEAWYDLGRAQMHQGHFDDAVIAFRHTLILQPENVKAMENLGLSLEAQNKPEDALKQYAAGLQQADRAAHPDESLLLSYGTLLNNRGAFTQSVPLLLRAGELAPDDPKALEELARAYTGHEQYERARLALEHAVKLAPADARLHFQLGRTYRSLGLGDKAKAEFSRSSDLYGTHSTASEP